MADAGSDISILEWVRTGAAVVVPFLAVYFATWRGLRNARTFYVESQQQKAERMLRATVMEMAANIKKLRPDVARAEHGFFLSEQSKTDNKDYWLELNENSPKPSISAYEALVEHFGVLLPDITARVMQFYEEIDLCYRQAKSLRGKEIDLDPEREEIHRLRPVVLSFGNAIHCWKDVVELSKINLSDFEEKADKLANRTIDQHSKSEIRALQGNISVEST